MRLVLASNNAKKLTELRTLFSALPIELVAQGELGVPEAEEPHLTFVENALAKARHAARASGGAAIADDSGLCVDALAGAPGVASAHFAPLRAPPSKAPDLRVPSSTHDRETLRALQDAANNRLLLERLQGAQAASERRASFVATLVALRHADDPEPLIAVGRWPGEILFAPRGSGGFGYDPLVFIAALGRSVAELDAVTKNALSHRALAAREMLALMRARWLA